MNLLGFDTSTAATSACVLRSDGEAFEVGASAAALSAAPAHARELLPAVASAMERSRLNWEELDAIGVGTGPGTFTGLRIGIATARALATARGLSVCPVSSLRALAVGIEAPLRLALIDARRGEVFGALYADGGREGLEQRWPPFAASPERLVARLREAAVAPLAAGDGALRFREPLEAAGVDVAPVGLPLHVVRGLHVCRLAAMVEAKPPGAVLPEYLRLPDARPAR